MIPAARESKLLDVSGLKTYVYTRQGVGRAVDGVTFELRRGETLGLVGESGSGKSMTALSILGLHPRPAARIVGGEIRFEGENLAAKPERELRRYRGAKISLIPQDPMTALNPVLTIGEQLAEPLWLHKRLRGHDARSRSVEMLQLLRVGAAEERLSAYPHQLSGGIRQRVVGAIALCCEPKLLIADEPTTALDVTTQLAYLSLLRDLQKSLQFGILFITHDFGVIGRMCDRVAVMYAGRLVETARTDRILSSPIHPYTKALLRSVLDARRSPRRLPSIEGQPPLITALPSGCRFHPRCDLYRALGAPERCRTTEPQLLSVDDESSVSCHFSGTLTASRSDTGSPLEVQRLVEGAAIGGTSPSVRVADGPSSETMQSAHPLLVLEDVRKRYTLRSSPFGRRSAQQIRAVDGVSFALAPHRTLSIVGESGSGKTTIARLVLRLEQLDSGTITFAETRLDSLSGSRLRRHRRRIQAMFQDPWSSLDPRMRVGESILEPFVALQSVATSEAKRRLDEVLALVGLESSAARRFPHEFSGGQRQRIAIARAICTSPQLIVLDEPVSALDVSIRAQIMNLLNDLQEELGVTYLLIAHDLATVRYLSHSVVVLYLGRVMEAGRSEDIFTQPQHPYTKLLLAASTPGVRAGPPADVDLQADVPSPLDVPSGCRFHPRCPLYARLGRPRICSESDPHLRALTPVQSAACHFANR